jgi:LysM repeat protein
MEYKIKKGDNLSSLAKRFNTTVEALAQANGIKDVNRIYAGKTLTVPEKQKQKPQAELKSGNGLLGDPAIFDPQAQALQGSYPELAMMGVPGMLKAVAAKGLLSAAPAVMKANPARVMPAVMRQNPTRQLNDLSRQALANETKFTIGESQIPDALMLERLLMARRFQ